MLGWNFIWGYIFFISWKLKLISLFFFWEDLPFFSDVFFCCLPIFKKIHFVVFVPQEPRSKCHSDPRNLHLPPNHLWECGLGGLDLPGGLCVLTRSLRGFFNLAAGGAGLFCSFFWILKGKVDGWLLTKTPIVNFVYKKSRKIWW